MSDFGETVDQDKKPVLDQKPVLKAKTAESNGPRIVEVNGKWIPYIYFRNHKYDFGRFDSQDEAAVAYNAIISRVQSVLSGADPPNKGDTSSSASGGHFESVEWRIQVLEKDLVRLRQSEASNVTRLSLADIRARDAEEKRKRDVSQAIEEVEHVRKKLRTVEEQARTDLDKAKSQISALEKERDQARANTDMVKDKANGKLCDVGRERNEARADLDKVKGQLCNVGKERDQACADLDKERDKTAKLQLALDITSRDHEKEVKRRRQCRCVVEIVEILD